MHNTSLVVFANFRIDNKERYLRLKDSFFSFKDISAEKWVINIRGSYKEQTKNFLQEHLKNKFYHYDMKNLLKSSLNCLLKYYVENASFIN